MLIGYARVSKSDGSQAFNLQRDALLETGVAPCRIYEDLASGRKDDRPGLASCLKALQHDRNQAQEPDQKLGRLENIHPIPQCLVDTEKRQHGVQNRSACDLMLPAR